MGMTMIEKILARHAGVDRVKPGDIVVCEVDKVIQLDLAFAVQGMNMMPFRIADPDRIAVVLDHTVPSPSVLDAMGHKRAREFVEKFGIKKFFDVGNHGICHQVILENGLALPGQILACTDSHTCASGAFNCAARGVGLAEILQIICTGKTWYKVAPTIKFVVEGKKPDNVFGKDIFLHIAGTFGSAEGYSVEFAGEGISSLTIDDRATLATMCAEISAEFATFPADDLIINHLKTVTDEPFEPADSDPDAEYAAVHTINLSELKPYVALPDFVPNNTVTVDTLADKVKIQQAFVGSCANGKLEDLRIAASIVKGKKVAPGVRLIVTPASQKIYKEAVRLGYVETLLEAGAVVTNSTCGACYGGHMGVLAPEETCITSSTRNFKGRMGSPEAKIYIGSSATVAASAIEGYITDPRPHLEGVVSA
ncbi:3-isopropylmalate dehydratase large subunit [Effusibacillus dendaii]|uniref:aconitate hydratase n=1 Tax=Effusibacillus dendaii TaxID=2743772 RepID=A0A7I8DE38_9BACL|nr:aconitase/3-isopropylmalate dehydratase large subunit family protein [Effusibacillus dendaii]BCJ86151.1 3-isopropylmalate dehydratase large subunit [Effusibacillus dendaii]